MKPRTTINHFSVISIASNRYWPMSHGYRAISAAGMMQLIRITDYRILLYLMIILMNSYSWMAYLAADECTSSIISLIGRRTINDGQYYHSIDLWHKCQWCTRVSICASYYYKRALHELRLISRFAAMAVMIFSAYYEASKCSIARR